MDPVGPNQPAAAPGSRAQRPGGAAPVGPVRPDVRVDTIPSTPPPELSAEVEAAAARAQELHEKGRELHFKVDSGKVSVEVCDLEGNVVREVSLSHVLDVAGGAPLEA
jgi:hypothetical protein